MCKWTPKGKWIGAYGKAGYNVIGNVTKYPVWVTVKEGGHASWTWAASSLLKKALQKADTPGDNIASRWYTNAYYGDTINIEVGVNDNQTHSVALYFLDWDTANYREQKVEIYDAATGDLLDTRTAAAFSDGKYFVWNLRGRVRIAITRTVGSGAVVSGLFFD